MTCPWSSTATHSLTDGHATPASWPVATSTGVLQMTVRAAGLVVIVMACPNVAAQSRPDAHQRPRKSPRWSLGCAMSTGLHAPWPFAGLVERTTSPVGSIARQSFVEGQDTRMMPFRSMLTGACHARLPPVGSVETTAFPSGSLATQRCGEGQDTVERDSGLTLGVTFQANLPPVGSVEVSTSPLPSTATHRLDEGHVTRTDSRCFIGSIRAPSGLCRRCPEVDKPAHVARFKEWKDLVRT
jgi:hypothetical protein